MNETVFSIGGFSSRGEDGGDGNVLKDEYDVAIFGAGPAGLTAAIYASRAKINVLVLEKETVGGEAASTDLIENYPGFPEGVRGSELAENMRSQAVRFGTQIVFGEPKILNLRGQPKEILINDKLVKAKSIVVASGTSSKSLNIPGEKEFKGKGVSYCATCDGPIFNGKNVAVIGCGNSGLQESLFLLRFVESLTMVEYLPTIQAEKILQDRLMEHKNVTCLLSHEVLSIHGDTWVRSITVKNRVTGESKEMPVSGVFVYVGLVPNTSYLDGQIDLDRWGYVLTDPKMQTSTPGVFAAGDVRQTELRQVATAIGNGAIAAASAQRFIESLNAGQ